MIQGMDQRHGKQNNENHTSWTEKTSSKKKKKRTSKTNLRLLEEKGEAGIS